MEQLLTLTKHIEKAKEGQYLEIPFEVPDGVERIDIHYNYKYFLEAAEEGGMTDQEVNIIDLALISPAGYVGASGSNRLHIYVSAADTSRGYMAMPVRAGTWTIIAGACRVEADGVEVHYEITLTMKTRRLLKGDLHMHSTASDGHLTTAELMTEAVRCGLDYICITDHNAFSQNDEMAAPPPGLTMIPGMELTHYKGHCNFLGVRRPVENPFGVNCLGQLKKRMKEAHDKGAVVSVNHPFSDCPWEWGLEETQYDLVEIWNGGALPEENCKCLEWWQGELIKGRKLPITGGSDFHFTEALRTVACPTTWVYAESREPEDILTALKAGHGFVTLNHQGPVIQVSAGEAILGDMVPEGTTVNVRFEKLTAGDRIHVITDQNEDIYTCDRSMKWQEFVWKAEDAMFIRFEVYRSTRYPSVNVPCLISNPVYISKCDALENDDDK